MFDALNWDFDHETTFLHCIILMSIAQNDISHVHRMFSKFLQCFINACHCINHAIKPLISVADELWLYVTA
jgi:hypothetical protein